MAQVVLRRVFMHAGESTYAKQVGASAFCGQRCIYGDSSVAELTLRRGVRGLRRYNHDLRMYD